MIKVVLDTNVLVSALIKRGKPRALILEVMKGDAQLILSKGTPHITSSYHRSEDSMSG